MLVKEPNWRNTLKGFNHTNCGVVEACLQFCENGVQNDIVDINFEFLFSIIGVIINGCFVAFIEKCSSSEGLPVAKYVRRSRASQLSIAFAMVASK